MRTVEAPVTRFGAIELLKRRIKESGLTTTKFAEEVLLREPRTVRRWLSGESPIPNIVLAWLTAPAVAPYPKEQDGNR